MAGLTWGSEDDDLGIGAVFVAAVADLYLVKKGGTVDNIQGAALGPVTVDVHQHNLAGLSADHQGIANRFPHIAGSNDDGVVDGTNGTSVATLPTMGESQNPSQATGESTGATGNGGNSDETGSNSATGETGNSGATDGTGSAITGQSPGANR